MNENIFYGNRDLEKVMDSQCYFEQMNALIKDICELHDFPESLGKYIINTAQHDVKAFGKEGFSDVKSFAFYLAQFAEAVLSICKKRGTNDG